MPTQFFRRSKQTLPTMTNATPTQLAFVIQDNHRQAFWYFLQFPDKTWHVFDVRWLGVEQSAWIKKVIHTSDLSLVAELIQSVADIFSLIREHEANA